MARPKKVTNDETEVSVPMEPTEDVAPVTPKVEQFDPSLPENKQRHLR